jgi:YHS domain-containing protein
MDVPLRAPGPPDGVATDPVCGMAVVIENATQTADHEGTTFFFCGKGCRLEFEEDPERFLDPTYVPSM